MPKQYNNLQAMDLRLPSTTYFTWIWVRPSPLLVQCENQLPHAAGFTCLSSQRFIHDHLHPATQYHALINQTVYRHKCYRGYGTGLLYCRKGDSIRVCSQFPQLAVIKIRNIKRKKGFVCVLHSLILAGSESICRFQLVIGGEKGTENIRQRY